MSDCYLTRVGQLPMRCGTEATWTSDMSLDSSALLVTVFVALTLYVLRRRKNVCYDIVFQLRSHLPYSSILFRPLGPLFHCYHTLVP